MKKYFLGFIAIITVITFIGFTGKFTTQTMMLTTDPTSAGIVQDESKWSDAGSLYGVCTATPEDLACTIKLQSATMSSYYHVDGSGNLQLNDEFYARLYFDFNNQSSSPRFLEVSESYVNPRYIISKITANKLQQITMSNPVTIISDNKNIQKQQNLSAGVDVAYFNGKKK